jgi:putative colanic acid biosynthesis acetyltransferase WcaF
LALLDASKTSPLTGGPSFSLGHRARRAVWIVAWGLLASWTPAPLHRWRVWLLNAFGAEVHPTAHVYGSARVWYPPTLTMAAHSCLGPRVNCYSMAEIRLEEFALVSQGSHLCTGDHDIEDPDFQLIVRPITIGAHAWVATEAFVGPGVTVGEYAVVGARTVVRKDVEPAAVYTGNPARLLRFRTARDARASIGPIDGTSAT